MSQDRPSPIRPTDQEACEMARGLMRDARFGAIGVIEAETGLPMVTRIAVGMQATAPVILISELSAHTAALAANPVCSLLVGEVGSKGDPLTHPRLTLQCNAVKADKATHRDTWLQTHPKSKLYIDFADFSFYELRVSVAYLNGGFGKAYHLTPADLGLA